jgi:uncharacterized protein (DUF2225 family)
MSFIELPLQSDLFQPGDIEKVETLINTCTACGFTATTDDFMRGKVELSDTVRQQMNTHWRGRDFSDVRAAEQYGLLAQLQLWEDAPPSEVAESYMKGAWCSAYHHSDDEMVYRLYALEHYKRALEANTVPAERLPEVTYLVGELHRRLGEVDRANVYFERIIERAKTDSGWAAMGQAARQQRDNPQNTFPTKTKWELAKERFNTRVKEAHRQPIFRVRWVIDVEGAQYLNTFMVEADRIGVDVGYVRTKTPTNCEVITLIFIAEHQQILTVLLEKYTAIKWGPIESVAVTELPDDIAVHPLDYAPQPVAAAWGSEILQTAIFNEDKGCLP